MTPSLVGTHGDMSSAGHLNGSDIESYLFSVGQKNKSLPHSVTRYPPFP